MVALNIKIEGIIEAPNIKSVDGFVDKFIDLIESQGWYYGGSLDQYVSDEDEDRKTIEEFRRLQRNCKLAEKLLDKVGMICRIFEVHEHPEIEAAPVVDEIRKLLKQLGISEILPALSIANELLTRKLETKEGVGQK